MAGGPDPEDVLAKLGEGAAHDEQRGVPAAPGEGPVDDAEVHLVARVRGRDNAGRDDADQMAASIAPP